MCGEQEDTIEACEQDALLLAIQHGLDIAAKKARGLVVTVLGAGPQGGGRSAAGPQALPWGLPSTFQKPRGLASSGPAASTARLLPRQGKPGSQAQGQSRGWARTSSGQVQAWLAAAPLCAERPWAPLPAAPAEHNRDGTGHRAAQLGSASRAGPGQKGRWSPSAPSQLWHPEGRPATSLLLSSPLAGLLNGPKAVRGS